MESEINAAAQLVLREPASPGEWERYFELRWQVLRAPWGQPRGSERDDLEPVGVHLGLWNVGGRPVAVGRLHLNSPAQAQVRYMAVAPEHVRSGFGTRVLAGLEMRARELGAAEVVLNSRAEARAFYEAHGYVVIGAGETLLGEIAHVRMRKHLVE